MTTIKIKTINVAEIAAEIGLLGTEFIYLKFYARSYESRMFKQKHSPSYKWSIVP